MGQEWYYSRDGKDRFGPFSQQHLEELARSGQLLRSDMVCKAGASFWIRADQVGSLFRAPPTAPISPWILWMIGKWIMVGMGVFWSFVALLLFAPAASLACFFGIIAILCQLEEHRAADHHNESPANNARKS